MCIHLPVGTVPVSSWCANALGLPFHIPCQSPPWCQASLLLAKDTSLPSLPKPGFNLPGRRVLKKQGHFLPTHLAQFENGPRLIKLPTDHAKGFTHRLERTWLNDLPCSTGPDTIRCPDELNGREPVLRLRGA